MDKPTNVIEASIPPPWLTSPDGLDVKTSGLHQKHERSFVEWIKQLGGYEVITFETNRIYRHGFSIIQKKYTLDNNPRPEWTLTNQ